MAKHNIRASKLSDSSPKAMSNNSDAPSAQAHLEMLEAEMESLRRRMKLLETRLIELDGREPANNNLSAVGKASTSTSSNSLQTPNAMAPAASVNAGSPTAPPAPVRKHRRRSPSLKDSDEVRAKRPARSKPRRRSRTSKLKRRLLFGYGLLIGGALLAVLVLMIINLFGTTHITLDGNTSIGTAASSDENSGVELEIDNKPDLDELRRAIENAEP